MAWLLDTNMWIAYLKQPAGALAAKIAAVRPQDIVTCSIIKAELLHGAEKYGNAERRRAKVEELLAPFVSHSFDDESAAHYARLTHDLESKGSVIGPKDRMIAAIALQHGLTLVTGNMDEFARVTGLAVENWIG